LPSTAAHIVYVDSGSTDGSPDIARNHGADVIELDSSAGHSAARARASGFARLLAAAPNVEFVQFIDGDCTLDAGWLPRAVTALDADEKLAAVWGWRDERHPDASPYNRICQIEWHHPPAGATRHFGGDVLVRVSAYRAAGGYDANVVSSEDHELSLRIASAGGMIRRLDAPETLHDSRIMRVGQWWRKCCRKGVGYVQVWQRHRRSEELGAMLREAFWSAIIPIAALAAAWPTRGWSLLLFTLYPMRILRIAWRHKRRAGATWREGLIWGTHCVATAWPYLGGIVTTLARSLFRKPVKLVEYRQTTP
jgi:glycosyltransferase involved in cell wall biosynthesis